jgi:hypothetical protein
VAAVCSAARRSASSTRTCEATETNGMLGASARTRSGQQHLVYTTVAVDRAKISRGNRHVHTLYTHSSWSCKHPWHMQTTSLPSRLFCWCWCCSCRCGICAASRAAWGAHFPTCRPACLPVLPSPPLQRMLHLRLRPQPPPLQGARGWPVAGPMQNTLKGRQSHRGGRGVMFSRTCRHPHRKREWGAHGIWEQQDGAAQAAMQPLPSA